MKASFYITRSLRKQKLESKQSNRKNKGKTEEEEDTDDAVDVAFGLDKKKKKIMNIDEEI